MTAFRSSTSRRSPEVPDRPRRPDSCSSAAVSVFTSRLPRSRSHVTKPGSIEPERVAITRPASGVKRSEEHPSELQSLMRISYAVFCLKKKQATQNKQQYTHQE